MNKCLDPDTSEGTNSLSSSPSIIHLTLFIECLLCVSNCSKYLATADFAFVHILSLCVSSLLHVCFSFSLPLQTFLVQQERWLSVPPDTNLSIFITLKKSENLTLLGNHFWGVGGKEFDWATTGPFTGPEERDTVSGWSGSHSRVHGAGLVQRWVALLE